MNDFVETLKCEYDGEPCPDNGVCIQIKKGMGIIHVCKRYIERHDRKH